MKVLSLAWKYHPSVTSGIGVACEGLNNALSKIVDLTVIYPKVSSVQVKEEIVLGSEDLTVEQRKLILKEYIEILEKDKFEVAVRLDPYYTPKRSKERLQQARKEEIEEVEKRIIHKEIKFTKIKEELLYEEVDVFGESVRDKIFLYNRLVEELAESIEFDVIHAHDWMTFLAGISLKDKYHKPLVLHVHSLEYDRVGHKDASWVYDIERYAMSKANKVISVSEYTKGIIESNYGLSHNHIDTVYNAVTLPKPLSGKKLKGNKLFKVLFAGRIDGNKGIEYFISIAEQVLKKTNDVEFIVVGSGKRNVRLDEIKGYQHIVKKFRYLGFVEREALFSLYSECDVLCMPSISEPFGLTAIEAAWAGLPVVLSIKTGASEILKRTPNASFWDIQKFASHILSIKKNPGLRARIISDNKKDIALLSWETSATKVVEVFQSVMN